METKGSKAWLVQINILYSVIQKELQSYLKLYKCTKYIKKQKNYINPFLGGKLHYFGLQILGPRGGLKKMVKNYNFFVFKMTVQTKPTE